MDPLSAQYGGFLLIKRSLKAAVAPFGPHELYHFRYPGVGEGERTSRNNKTTPHFKALNCR